MRTTIWFERLAVLGFLVALTLLVLVPASPLFQMLPSWDSGIFLYTGWRISAGEVLYRALWDHKPPLIYWINALGVLLANGSRWGIWAIEFVSLLAAALLGFSLIRRAFGVLTAVYASAAWMFNAFITMDGGNYTTEFALPLQFGLLWLVGTAPEGVISARRAFVLGILSTLAFWFKQNLLGIPIAIVLALALDFLRGHRRDSVRAFAAIMGGALLTCAIVLLPFAVQGTLVDLWQAAFLFNFSYIEETWLDRLMVLRFLPITLPAFGLAILAIVGWLIAVLAFLNGIRERGQIWARWGDMLERLWGNRTAGSSNSLAQAQVMRLITLVVIALPLEIFFVILSGNLFDHYFLALLPVFTVLAAFSFRLLLAMLERVELARWLRVAFVLAVVVVLAAFSAESARIIYRRISSREANGLINYIRENTAAEDRVVIWGGEHRVSFEARRVSPIRFANFAPLRPRAPNGFAYTHEVLDVIANAPPRWIVALGEKHEAHILEFPTTDAEIEQEARAILSHYHVRETNDDWTVYEYQAP